MQHDTQFIKAQNAAHSGAFGFNPMKTPTIKMQEAGNYKKGSLRIFGLDIAIENPAGTYRDEGKSWRVADHYGYIKGIVGADGDNLDCFVGGNLSSRRIFVINQKKRDGSFDEHKAMIGYDTPQQAILSYQLSYEHGWHGLHSIVPMSVKQFKFWLDRGNKSNPVTSSELPIGGDYELPSTLSDLLWTDNEPNHAIDNLLIAMRRMNAHGEMGDLLVDPVDMDDLTQGSEQVVMLDALVSAYSKLKLKMTSLQKAMARKSELADMGAEIQISEPFKRYGSLQVSVLFTLTDGQTIAIFFHNPDTTPNKITPQDSMVSWKWMLNKKDVTIVVAPESGQDISVNEVAMRIMKLAEKNAPLFAKAQARKGERVESIKALREEVKSLESREAELIAEIEKRKAGGSVVTGALPKPNKTRNGSENNPLEIDSDDQYQALGVATITDIGSENVYVEKDGLHYYAKVGNTQKYFDAGLDRGDVADFSNAKFINGWSLPVKVEQPQGGSAVGGEQKGGNIDSIIANMRTVVTDSPMVYDTEQDQHSKYVVMRATRPLVGTETMEANRIMGGGFWALIDRNDEFAANNAETNKKLDATIHVAVKNEDELNKVALYFVKDGKYFDRYVESISQENYNEAIVEQLKTVAFKEERTYSEMMQAIEWANSFNVEQPQGGEQALTDDKFGWEVKNLLKSNGWSHGNLGLEMGVMYRMDAKYAVSFNDRTATNEVSYISVMERKEGKSRALTTIGNTIEFGRLDKAKKTPEQVVQAIEATIAENTPTEQPAPVESEPIVITGKELGDFPDTEEGKKQLRAAAEKHLMAMRGEWVDCPAIGKKIEIRRRGIKKTISFSAGDEKLKLLAAIKGIIASGTSAVRKDNEKKDSKPDVLGYYYLKSTPLLNGREIALTVVIEEDKNGLLHYDMLIDRAETKKALLDSALSSATLPKTNLGTLQMTGRILPNILDSVNSKMVINLFIEGEEPEYIDDEGSDDDSSTNVTPQAAQENKDEAKNHITKEGFLERIEALRQGTEEEYQANIDQLADDIERAGMMDEFDDILKQLDDEKDTTVQKVQAAMRAGLL